MAGNKNIRFLSAITIGKEQKKYCRFLKNGIKYIDYKDPDYLLNFINEQGKILPRRLTGLNTKQQRNISKAIKNARIMGFLPFIRIALY